MAFVDMNVSMKEMSASAVVDLADRFVSFARHTAHAATTKANDDVFTAKRLRASRLPSVQSCQSSIFSQLRQIEEQKAKTVIEKHSEPSEPCAARLKAQFGKLFTKH